MTEEISKMGRPRIPLVTQDLGPLEDKLPPKPIVLREVIYWMDLGATAEEIAGSFHVSIDTLGRRIKEELGLTFAELKQKVCGFAKIKLRINQFRMSEKNAAMAIWLGKQWLGQKDNDTTIVAPPELTQQFNAIMVQIGRRQQEIQESSLPHNSKDLLTQSDISPNNSLKSLN